MFDTGLKVNKSHLLQFMNCNAQQLLFAVNRLWNVLAIYWK